MNLRDWQDVRGQFMLKPGEIYLNAGTFSALPRPVYEEWVALIAAGEANPTRVAAWRGRQPLWDVQQQIARYVGADPLDIILHVNVTHALNQALFCLSWPRTGEFLASDREYGSIVKAAREMARRNGLSFRTFKLPPQPSSPDEVCEAVRNALSPQTVGLLISHVTSGTGIVVPVEKLAALLRPQGIRLIVDGAHGPGLLPLQLGATEIDVYGGNLHKWFMGPKGTAFLYVARQLHDTMEPHIVGWGGTPRDTGPLHSSGWDGDDRFQQVFRIQGLLDYSSFLALRATLKFREEIGEERILERIDSLVRYVRQRLGGDLKLRCLSPPPEMNAGLLAFVPPAHWQVPDASNKIYEQYHITVPIRGGPYAEPTMRISPHIWNGEDDMDRLADALGRP